MRTPLPRRLFFWTLAVSYVTTTAVVLFFVFGYKHDFTENIFIHTGSITIAPNPQRNITISIDGKKPKSKLVNFINDSYYISGLRPRTYDVTVSRDGFKSWKKDVPVHSGVSTEFWNITLVRDSFERTEYDIDNVDQFFPAPEENIFALTRQLGQTLSVLVYDTDRDITTNTFLFTQHNFTQDERENIEWDPDSNDLIIPIQNTETQRNDYVIAYTKDDISYLLSEFISLPKVHNVRWDPKDPNVIYLLSNTSLFRTELDLANETILLTPIANDVIDYDFTDDGIYLLTNENRVLYNSDVHGIDFEEITKFDISQNMQEARLIAYDKNRFIVIDDTNRDLFIYNKAERNIYNMKLGTSIIGAHFSDDGKKLIYYSPFEIFAYFTRDWDAQPIRRENDSYSIIRFSQLLDNVHFSKDYEHVIYTVGNEIKMTELDYRGNRITDTVMTLDQDDTTLINKHKKNLLYFTDSTGDVARRLFSIEFPEKETLF